MPEGQSSKTYPNVRSGSKDCRNEEEQEAGNADHDRPQIKLPKARYAGFLGFASPVGNRDLLARRIPVHWVHFIFDKHVHLPIAVLKADDRNMIGSPLADDVALVDVIDRFKLSDGGSNDLGIRMQHRDVPQRHNCGNEAPHTEQSEHDSRYDGLDDIFACKGNAWRMVNHDGAVDESATLVRPQ